MAKITLDKIAHSYLKNPQSTDDYALRELNLDWEDGKAYALLGPSGCGKSTLLNIISGLLIPSEGRLLFDGKDVTSYTTAARNIAQVFQFPVVYDTMTVYDNLAFPLRNLKNRKESPVSLSNDEIDKKVRSIADMLGLSERLKHKASGLSADAKQTISLGRGLVRDDVAAILFDEPLTVIDPHLKWQLRSKLKHLHQKFDYTMIYVTHDQTEALTFADEVVLMTEGEVVQIGTPEELFNTPEHTFAGYFIGSPGMNILPASLKGNLADVNHAEIPLPEYYHEDALPSVVKNKSLKIGVRPEFVSVSNKSGDFPVEVIKVEDVGRHRVIRMKLGEEVLHAVLEEADELNAEIIETGAAYASFNKDAIHLYADEWRVKPD